MNTDRERSFLRRPPPSRPLLVALFFSLDSLDSLHVLLPAFRFRE